jgi:hypothetical protein
MCIEQCMHASDITPRATGHPLFDLLTPHPFEHQMKKCVHRKTAWQSDGCYTHGKVASIACAVRLGTALLFYDC